MASERTRQQIARLVAPRLGPTEDIVATGPAWAAPLRRRVPVLLVGRKLHLVALTDRRRGASGLGRRREHRHQRRHRSWRHRRRAGDRERAVTLTLAVDAGTTGVRAFAVDETGTPRCSAYRELTQHYPRPGSVEHDPDEIWTATQATL